MCLFTVEEILWMCTRDDVGRGGKRRYKVNFQFAVMAQTRRDLNPSRAKRGLMVYGVRILFFDGGNLRTGSTNHGQTFRK